MGARPRKKIGEILIEAELIDAFQLRSALADQRRWGNRLGRTLVKLGFVEEEALLRELSKQMEIPLLDLAQKRISPEVLDLVPGDMAIKFACVPLFVAGDVNARRVFVGMEEPADVTTLDALRFRTGVDVEPVLVSPHQIQQALARYYGAQNEATGGWERLEFVEGDQIVGPEDLMRPDQWAPSEAQRETESAGSRNEVPTREILRALTQLLVEKGLIDRKELIDRLRAAGRKK